MSVSSSSTRTDIFYVYSSRLKELLERVENEFKSDLRQADKMRLAAMQLVLHYEHLESMFQWSDKASSALTAQVQKVENELQAFGEFRCDHVIFLVYYKMIQLLAKIYYDPLKNFSVSKHWLNTAEQMYMELLTQREELQLFDSQQLFSKTARIKPLKDGFKFIDSLFSENIQLFEQILQNESIKVEHLLQIPRSKADASVWFKQLFVIIPQLLEQGEFKAAAYFLQIAQKIATEQNTKVRSAIATHWMCYLFDVFSESKSNLLNVFSEEQMAIFRRSVVSTRNTEDCQSHSPSSEDCLSIPENVFDCFANSIPLSQNELQQCVISIANVMEAKALLTFSAKMLLKLIRDIDCKHDPLNFIAHHYQMSDLLLIYTIVSDKADECFSIQDQRYQCFRRMINCLKNQSPVVFSKLATALLTDLNEILIDLYSSNFWRILPHSAVGDGEKETLLNQLDRGFVQLHELDTHLLKESSDQNC